MRLIKTTRHDAVVVEACEARTRRVPGQADRARRPRGWDGFHTGFSGARYVYATCQCASILEGCSSRWVPCTSAPAAAGRDSRVVTQDSASQARPRFLQSRLGHGEARSPRGTHHPPPTIILILTLPTSNMAHPAHTLSGPHRHQHRPLSLITVTDPHGQRQALAPRRPP